MNSKAMTFQPAPRPQPRVSPQQTRDLAEATRDLGFGRTTTTPEPETAGPTPATATAPAVADSAPAQAKPQSKSTTQAMAHTATLKVALPDEIWAALRHEALNRRVTMKYLVMEALAAKGYDVDMSQIAEDGRRDR